jgi:hypothetical protein
MHPFSITRCRKIVAALLSLGAAVATAKSDPVDFNRHVRPILSENCFACHGFDANTRKADLRLDTREGATEVIDGSAAIVPGSPDKSTLIKRITTSDADDLMPPEESHKKPLLPEQIATLRQWITEGAIWGEHWAFVPPAKADTPGASHPVDHFVALQLAENKQPAAPPAPVHTLARRLSFDLTGLPPTAAQIESFNADHAKDPAAAIAKFADTLLASPHFGERMAMWWLDAARYSDTDGFQQDAVRNNWPWRDWVIDSFNANKPFDQFTLEQFAGDLLPNPTPEQIIATCFHRNHMTNGEGGRDPVESRVDYVLDRVNTTGTAFLGLTLACTQCHDHKFDPISQADYYSLAAYFNSIDEDGRAGGGAKPYYKYQSKKTAHALAEYKSLLGDSRKSLDALRRSRSAEFEKWLEGKIAATRDGFQPWIKINPKTVSATEGSVLSVIEGGIVAATAGEQVQDDYLVTAEVPRRVTGFRLEVLPDAGHTDGKLSHSPDGEFTLTNVKLRVLNPRTSLVRDIPLRGAVADVTGKGRDSKYGSVGGTLDDDPRTGWTTRTKPADQPHHAVFELVEPVTLAQGELLQFVLMHRSLEERSLIGRFRLSTTDQRGQAVRSLSAMPMEQLAARDNISSQKDLTGNLRNLLFEQFLEDDSAWLAATSRHAEIKRQLAETEKASKPINVMVLKQRAEPRATHILLRGVWDKHGEAVSPAVLPAVLPRDPAAVPGRIELARWITSAENPLTARVITNQIWQLMFGAGLVRTPADFGIQGELPTHPDLLDWLAVDFVESGWDVKHLIHRIVTSSTYAQDSAVSPQLLELDPDNRLLARGARFRLPSWMLRDAKLAAAGLLNPALGGPPVFPHQPPGIWNDQFMGRFKYLPSLGPAQHRRTLYAFWRRTSTPTFLFDTSARRTCETTVRLTNTPLQALNQLNDITALEAARALADSAVARSDTPAAIVDSLARSVISRSPTAAEAKTLAAQYLNALEHYDSHPADAVAFTRIGQDPPPTTDTTARTAAAMLVANLILNLDEAITHE